jgi:hypothetical protein
MQALTTKQWAVTAQTQSSEPSRPWVVVVVRGSRLTSQAFLLEHQVVLVVVVLETVLLLVWELPTKVTQVGLEPTLGTHTVVVEVVVLALLVALLMVRSLVMVEQVSPLQLQGLP